MNKRFEVLDSFRGISAIFVVIFHLHIVDTITQWSFFRHSSSFVEFFFVLSGFVLTHSYGYKTKIKFKNFIIARTFRLFPLHIVVLFVFIILEAGKMFAYQKGYNFNNIPFENLKSPDEIIPNLLLLQSWLPNANALSWNYPSWSISIEYYTYIIFFVTLLMIEKYKTFVWFFISLILSYLIFKQINFGISNDIFKGLSCFFGGSITYLIYLKVYDKINNYKDYFTIIEAIAIVLLIFLVISDIKHKSSYTSLYFCIYILIFAFEKGYISQLFKKNIFIYLGRLSYSIYMIHAVILFCTISIFMIIEKISNTKLTPIIDNIRYIDIGNPILNYIVLIIILSTIIFISNFTYKYIELRGQKIGKKLI